MPAGSVVRVYRPSLGNAPGRRPPDSDIFEGHGAFALRRFVSFLMQEFMLGELPHHMFGMMIEPFGM